MTKTTTLQEDIEKAFFIISKEGPNGCPFKPERVEVAKRGDVRSILVREFFDLYPNENFCVVLSDSSRCTPVCNVFIPGEEEITLEKRFEDQNGNGVIVFSLAVPLAKDYPVAYVSSSGEIFQCDTFGVFEGVQKLFRVE